MRWVGLRVAAPSQRNFLLTQLMGSPTPPKFLRGEIFQTIKCDLSTDKIRHPTEISPLLEMNRDETTDWSQKQLSFWCADFDLSNKRI